jgi:predicted transcriptional regulator
MHTVDELMTTNVRTARETDVIGPIRDLMLDENIHAVPVLDEQDTLVGIVTSADLVEEWAPAQGVQTVMTRRVFTTDPHSTAVDAARLMVDHRIHHLVVLDHSRVAGILSSFDLLRHLAGRVEHLVTMREPSALRAAAGDTIVVRPNQVGGRERRAKVIEVHGEDGAGPYTVRWSDDQHDQPHLTMFFPGGDAYVVPAESAAVKRG